ncbi:hypothetical protein HY484_02220 [Candidatus Woesearchaeota archaeon]|nr:hypothetical protein [Candidatus Woesearchaeota archaeon]
MTKRRYYNGCEYNFRPSRQTIEHAIHAQGRNARRLDITSEHLPMPETPISIRAVQENIATRLMRIIDYLRQTDTSKNTGGYTLMDKNKQFVPAVQERLEKKLYLDRQKQSYQQFLNNLAEEFYNWLELSTERRNTMGAVIEKDIGVFITQTRLPY